MTEQTINKDYYIIADHMRTAIFCLADGANFGPKGTGYILRKLVKRAVWLSYIHKISKEDLQKISQKIIEINSEYYKHLVNSFINNELTKEIDKQLLFIKKSFQKLENYCLLNKKITAQTVFFWCDTQGIPLELINYYLEKKECSFDEKEKLNELLEQQRNKSKADRKTKNIEKF